MLGLTLTSPRPGMDGDDETIHGRGGENDLGDLVATIIEPDWSIYEGGRWLDGSWDYPTRGDGGTQTERADEVPTSEIEDTNEIQATKAGGVIQIEIVNGNWGGRWSEVSLNDHMLRDVKSCPAPPTIQEAYDSSDSEESHSPGESWYFPCGVCGETWLEQHHAYCGVCGDSIGNYVVLRAVVLRSLVWGCRDVFGLLPTIVASSGSLTGESCRVSVKSICPSPFEIIRMEYQPSHP